MRINKLNFLIIMLIGIVIIILIITGNNITENVVANGVYTFEGRREKVLSDLNFAIKDAKKEGKYKCCIEPACTMCYLGNWIWKDGTCDCDGMIAEGKWDKVCPQCKKGIEEGLCKSTNKLPCDLDTKENFRSMGLQKEKIFNFVEVI